MDLSRLEAEPPRPRPVPLDSLTREQVERQSDRARDAGIELRMMASPVTVDGSRKDLSLLVGNLLDNAGRYTPSGGRIDVTVGRNDERIVLEVKGHGGRDSRTGPSPDL